MSAKPNEARRPLPLTTAIGSLLRVAARLNFLTCVFFSKALAKSFSVGIGMFWNTNDKDTPPSAQGKTSRFTRSCSEACVCVPAYLDVVQVDLR